MDWGAALHFHEIGVNMKFNPENMILLLCIVITIVFIVLMLMAGGCSHNKKLQTVDVLCVGNDTVFHAQGSAVEMSGADWDRMILEGCEAELESETSSATHFKKP